MAPRKPSLRDLSRSAKGTELAAANFAPGTDRIVLLDPTLVHSGGLQDRFSVDEDQLAALAESIKTEGQKIPILVRPHRTLPGTYEIVAGRRRLEACRMAGISVRAEVQDLDDQSLVITQAIENIAREDLSYIERACLAVRMVDEAGLDPSAVDNAFTCDKTERSRYLKIGRAVPAEIISYVGKALPIGRPRWEQFARLISSSQDALQAVYETMKDDQERPNTLAASVERFELLFTAALEKKPSKSKSPPVRFARTIRRGRGKPFAKISRVGADVQLTFFENAGPEFLDWFAENVDAMIDTMFRKYGQAVLKREDELPPGSGEATAGKLE